MENCENYIIIIFRLISYYYFLRYGDDYRKNKIRSRMGDKHTFDECVANGLPDCEPKKLWQQVIRRDTMS